MPSPIDFPRSSTIITARSIWKYNKEKECCDVFHSDSVDEKCWHGMTSQYGRELPTLPKNLLDPPFNMNLSGLLQNYMLLHYLKIVHWYHSAWILRCKLINCIIILRRNIFNITFLNTVQIACIICPVVNKVTHTISMTTGWHFFHIHLNYITITEDNNCICSSPLFW